MAEPTVPVGNPHVAEESHANPTALSQSEAILQDILTTMHDSDIFPQMGKDPLSRFWSAYERVAKQHDDEFLDRHNSDMDVLLIFAGLFSAVSAAFIVNMQSSLSPDPSDTTNALLMILISKIDNGTFPNQGSTLPIWPGPSPMVIWTQSLAYASLFTSLLAAFGAVLGKQWLEHFKTSRLGRGSLHERCKRRQHKLDGLQSWKFSTIMSALPILLQLSLLSFGISIAANIWTQQHTIASIIIGITALGAVFYFFTVIASLKSPDCPFQTPLSTVLQHFLTGVVAFGDHVLSSGHEHPESWEGILINMTNILKRHLKAGRHVFARAGAPFLKYISRIPTALRQRSQLPADDPEFTGGPEKFMSSKALALGCLDSPSELAEVHAIQWILETSTESDTIAAAVKMVPEVGWPNEVDVTGILDRLKNYFYACFDPTRQLLPLTQSRAVACLKAIFHICIERDQSNTFSFQDGGLFSWEHYGIYQVPHDPCLFAVSCVVNGPTTLDIASLPLSDCMWMARMFTYRLQRRRTIPDALVISMIKHGLVDSISPPRLVADCLLLVGLMIGLPTDGRQLTRLDKSSAIPELRESVRNRMLDVLLGDATVAVSLHERRYPVHAKMLLHPLLQYLDRYIAAHPSHHRSDGDLSVNFIKLCFRLLEEDRQDKKRPSENEGGSQIIPAVLRHSLSYSMFTGKDLIWGFLGKYGPGPAWYTQAQFDLLVDYLVCLCQDTDYDAIRDALVVMAGIRGSPSTPEKKCLYVETMIRLMSPDVPSLTCMAALNATSTIKSDIALLGRDDESFRDIFSQALASAVLGRDPATQHQANRQRDEYPCKDRFFNLRDLCYLRLLCALCSVPAWHPQLQRHGHFNSCLAIGHMLSSPDTRDNLSDAYAVHVTHVFALIDALGENHSFLREVKGYPTWPLILRAWHFIFSIFGDVTKSSWMELSRTGYLEALPPLVSYASRYWERWDNSEQTSKLIELVGHVSNKLDEEMQSREQGTALSRHQQAGDSFGNQKSIDLMAEITELRDLILKCSSS